MAYTPSSYIDNDHYYDDIATANGSTAVTYAVPAVTNVDAFTPLVYTAATGTALPLSLSYNSVKSAITPLPSSVPLLNDAASSSSIVTDPTAAAIMSLPNIIIKKPACLQCYK
jgi:hypothetical protein